jgi:hypothetical protein
MLNPAVPRETSSRSYIIILLLLGLIISLPVFVYGIPDLANDAGDHALRAVSFAQQLSGGEVFPRWLTRMNGGFGSPAFFFYPPLSTYVSVLFWFLLPKSADPGGWAICGYACVVATLLSGLFCYLWMRRLVTERSALIGAIVYMIAPYHLAIDLYNRGAAAEYWVFVWLPLIMISVERIIADDSYGVIWLALTYSLSVLSHTTVAACFAAIPVAYALVFSQGGSRIRSAIRTVAGLAMGVGISGFFVLPAALDQGKTYTAQTEGWGDYRNWWLFDIRDKITEAGTIGAGIPWYLSFKMRMLVITLWMLFFCIFAYWFCVRSAPAGTRHRFLDRAMRNRHAVFYLVVVLTCFFLMLRQSDLVWRLNPILRLLQLPLRLHTMIVLAAAMLSAMAWENVEKNGVRWVGAVLILTMGAWLATDMVFARQAFGVWRSVSVERAEHAAWMARTQLEVFSTYWPRYSPAAKFGDMAAFDRLIAEHPPKTAVFSQPKAGSATIVNWQPRSIELSVHTAGGGEMILNHFYYDGWTAYEKTGHVAIPLTPSHPDGLMELSVPPGNYAMVVQLPLEWTERTGFWITILSLSLVAGLAVWRWYIGPRTISALLHKSG